MNVRDLIAALADLDGDTPVHIAYQYGDYWRTIVAPAVRSVSEASVEHSAYHSMDKLADEDDERDDGENGRAVKHVIVIR